MKSRSSLPAVLLGLFFGLILGTQPADAAAAFGIQNIRLEPGLNLIGPQLASAGGNTVSNIFRFTERPPGTTVYKLVDGHFTTNRFGPGAWDRPEETIPAGDAAFVLNPSSEAIIISHHGEILQGELSNPIPAGLSLQSSMVLRDGKVTTDFGLRLSPFDNLYLWEEGSLKVFTWLPNETWTPYEPVLNRGQGCMINAAQPVEWIIEFQFDQ